MSEQAEVIKLLETIRAKRDLGIFAVEPKKSRKQREAEQSVAPDLATITATPAIVQSDLEEDKVIEIPSTVTPLMPKATESVVVSEEVKSKLPTPKKKDNKVHHSPFLERVQQAEDTFSFEQKRRFYLDDKLYHKLSLLKFSSNIPSVSTFINILISQVLEENHKDIEAVLRDLNNI
jgi:UDP-N-acetyl-D-mannosaminuronate dehydrogenase